MKKVIEILKAYLLQRSMLKLTLALMIYTAVLVFLEYRFHLKREWINSRFFYSDHFWKHFLFYAIPMLGVMPLLYFFGERRKLHWGGTLLFLMLVALAFTIRGSLRLHRELASNFDVYTYGVYILNNVFTGPAMMLIPLIWWYIVDRNRPGMDSGKEFYSHAPYGFYGIRFNQTDYKAYFLLLLAMVPLIVLASTQSDFINYYPKGAGIFPEGKEGVWHQYMLYEMLYGFDFVYIEFFFRGFLVIGLARFAGKQAIPIAAVFYCTIHFGKPLGETISSFFGGMILGTLALETGSVLGGIIVHMGIAWLMELGGWIGRVLNHG